MSLVRTFCVGICVWSLGGWLGGQSLAAAELMATLADGSNLSGDCLGLGKERLEVQTADGLKSIPMDQVASLSFPNEAAREKSGAFAVQLVGGSKFYASTVNSDGKNARLQVADAEFSIPAGQLFTLQLQALDVEQQRAWQAITESVTKSDVLVLIRPTGALTKVEGIVLGISEGAVQFDLDGQQVDVAFEKLAGIRFFNPNPEQVVKVAAVVRDVFQNEWICAGVAVEAGQDQLTLELRSGQRLEMPWKYLASVDYSLGRRKYLADLPPIRHRADRLFDFSTTQAAEETLFGLRRIPAMNLPGQVLGPSLEFAGDGEATFEVPDGSTRFSGTVKLQPKGNRITPCKVAVTIEGKLGWESELVDIEQIEAFELEVAAGQRLRLVVSSSSTLPTGNVVRWLEPTLLK